MPLAILGGACAGAENVWNSLLIPEVAVEGGLDVCEELHSAVHPVALATVLAAQSQINRATETNVTRRVAFVSDDYARHDYSRNKKRETCTSPSTEAVVRGMWLNRGHSRLHQALVRLPCGVNILLRGSILPLIHGHREPGTAERDT
jgi:hypothetical protein